jgi:hypothetical protein
LFYFFSAGFKRESEYENMKVIALILRQGWENGWGRINKQYLLLNEKQIVYNHGF